MGVSFECPVHRKHRYAVWFANPIDGGMPLPTSVPNECRWQRGGATFDDLSLTPSVDASAYCGCQMLRRRRAFDPSELPLCAAAGGEHTPCWHGFIVAGAVV